jgi:hypothetical protein
MENVTTERLMRLISPLEDPAVTSMIRQGLEYAISSKDTLPLHRHMRGNKKYHRVVPTELWKALFGTAPDNKELTQLGRSLQALLWERSARNGLTVYIKSVEDFESDGC